LQLTEKSLIGIASHSASNTIAAGSFEGNLEIFRENSEVKKNLLNLRIRELKSLLEEKVNFFFFFFDLEISRKFIMKIVLKNPT
jgi:hypothetical protein